VKTVLKTLTQITDPFFRHNSRNKSIEPTKTVLNLARGYRNLSRRFVLQESDLGRPSAVALLSTLVPAIP